MTLTLQDLTAILGPIGTILIFMWYRIDKLETNLNKKIDNVEQRLGEKTDYVRDRVSRVEGQLAHLAPAKLLSVEGRWPMMAAEQNITPKLGQK